MLVTLLLGSLCTVSGADRPNIVVFVADDLGWSDLGYSGSSFYESPNIDALSKRGMVFTNAYSNGPNCAPSRASLISGMYTPRHGIYTVASSARGKSKDRRLIPIENTTVLRDNIATLPEQLKTLGYRTGHFGKWHLGADPTTQGMDVNIAGREWGSPSGGGYRSPFAFPNLKSVGSVSLPVTSYEILRTNRSSFICPIIVCTPPFNQKSNTLNTLRINPETVGIITPVMRR